MSLCPGTKKFPCPAVPLSRDKSSSKHPGTSSSVPGRPAGQNGSLFCPLLLFSEKKIKKNFDFFYKFFLKTVILLSRGTSRDRGACPGIFAAALVPGQRDSGTRKLFLSWDKGTRKLFCPGTKGCPVPDCTGTSLENPSTVAISTVPGLVQFTNRTN